MIRREFVKTLALSSLLVKHPDSVFASSPLGPPTDTFPSSPGLTKYVSDFIVSTKYEDIPEGVMTLGKKTILDGFGLALAGSASTLGPLIRKYIETGGFSGGSASIIGTGMKAQPRFAALANGISIHADDFDDMGSGLHVTAPVLPAIFALCQNGKRSGRDLLLAYQVGVEVENKIGEAISPRHDADGFHTTGTIGSFGSAAACAKLYGLDLLHTSWALGIAGSEAAGIRENIGTMTKPFHAGHAAESGIVASDLAAIGWTATDQILEGPLGFFHAAGGGYTPEAIAGRLGRPWMFVSPGDLIKRFPCGTIQQSYMDEALRLVQENKLTPGQIEKVDITGNRANMATLFHHRPKTGLEAKFSLEYAVSIILVEGKAGLTQFTDVVVQRPDVQDIVRRATYVVDPELEKAGDKSLQSVLMESGTIKIYLKDGQTIEGRTKPSKGNPKNPMTYEEVADKFRGNAEFAKWPSQKTESIIEQVRTLESAPDMTRLTAALTT